MYTSNVDQGVEGKRELHCCELCVTPVQHPFARTHSVDSALPNPDLLDTPPGGGLFATSTVMPSLLETSDSQGFQTLWQVWIGNVLPDVSRHDILAILDRFGPVQDVITFTGHSYAIANFLDEGSAAQAVASLHEQQVRLSTYKLFVS